MSIDFDCPSCGKHYSLKDELAGKKGKCGKCGNALTIPQPPAAPAEDDEYRLAPLLDEELDNLPVAGGSPTTESPGKCPSCSADLSPEAVLCVNCGFHLKTGKTVAGVGMEAPAQVSTATVEAVKKKTRPKKVAGGFNFKTLAQGTALSLVGALIGGGLWAGVAIATDRSLGILAWAIGGLAGAGMSIGHDDDDGTIAGIIAACMALVGIVFGKGLWFAFLTGTLGGDVDADQRDYVADIVVEDQLRAQDIDPDGEDEEYDYDKEYEKAQETVKSWGEEKVQARIDVYEKADRYQARELIYDEQLEEIGKTRQTVDKKTSRELYQKAYKETAFMADQQIVALIEENQGQENDAEATTPDREVVIDDEAMEDVAAGFSIIGFIILFFVAFGFFDIIFIVLALGTAFKVASGKMSG